MQEGIVEPVGRALQQRLRRAVLDHAQHERRRVFDPVLRLGDPAGPHASLVLTAGERTDHALRCDVVAAMVVGSRTDGVATPLAWLVRSGNVAEPCDADLDWLAATRAAGAELGLLLPFVVVNRRAWRDPCSGVGRSWQRLRQR